MHSELKPNNLLFDLTGKLKLTDFGSTEQFGMSQCGTITRMFGIPYYVALEVLWKKYNEKIDVWNADVILYILLTRDPLFYNETPVEMFETVLQGNLRFLSRIFR
ncbi:hypothetical protein L1987_64944 [Smallanthus sonchifolius]|uniref:Uncharacterized protein n=1 Tax=Smallanthus sonchifolius TaxID=185202 RepID=A0ACB9BSZ3_9ASTR|nr:hypothetical protein L1987_64944 [Smallanthus sonchifolius]